MAAATVSFHPAASTAAVMSAFTRAIASAPRAYISFRVSAVAMPAGNGSRSSINMRRRNSTATKTPSDAQHKSHNASSR